jgi:hypothetical protein
MADEPKTEDPEIPAEPEHAADTDPRADARNESTDEVSPDVIDDDRFQATDN